MVLFFSFIQTWLLIWDNVWYICLKIKEMVTNWQIRLMFVRFKWFFSHYFKMIFFSQNICILYSYTSKCQYWHMESMWIWNICICQDFIWSVISPNEKWKEHKDSSHMTRIEVTWRCFLWVWHKKVTLIHLKGQLTKVPWDFPFFIVELHR